MSRPRWFHRCSCGRAIPEGVVRCSSRTCPEFAPTWARDTRRRLFENLRTIPLSVMFSVTAPGADLFPFDARWCSHPADARCSGRTGCRVNPEAARAFNQKAGRWWSELNRVAKQRADRATGFKGGIAARVWEKQKRGLAHLHGVVPVSTPEELAWAKVYVDALVELAPSKGFGFVDGWHKIGRKFWPGVQAAAYLSSYFVGSAKKAKLTENVMDGDLPRLVVFVARRLTSSTRCTMRNLRVARTVWAWENGLIDSRALSEGELLVARCLLARVRVPARAP